MTDTQVLENKLNELRQRYFSQLPSKLDEINQLWEEMKSSREYNKLLERAFHKIAGSAGMYGADELTDEARRIEYKLVEFAESKLSDEDISLISTEITTFAELIHQLST